MRRVRDARDHTTRRGGRAVADEEGERQRGKPTRGEGRWQINKVSRPADRPSDRLGSFLGGWAGRGRGRLSTHASGPRCFDLQ